MIEQYEAGSATFARVTTSLFLEYKIVEVLSPMDYLSCGKGSR